MKYQEREKVNEVLRKVHLSFIDLEPNQPLMKEVINEMENDLQDFIGNLETPALVCFFLGNSCVRYKTLLEKIERISKGVY